jgi:hypothetical protein
LEINDTDPNKVDFKPYKIAKTCAILKKPAGTSLLVKLPFEDTGGTYHLNRLQTLGSTYMRAQISRSQPSVDSNGMLFFNEVEIAVDDPLSNLHDIELTPLTPGNDYF